MIREEKPQQCDFCGKIEELRPYGPDGECVCFECGMKDEEACKIGLSRRLEMPSWTYFCEQCQEKHCEKSQCNCGACLYKHAKWIPDDMYPLFECMKCGKTVFWD